MGGILQLGGGQAEYSSQTAPAPASKPAPTQQSDTTAIASLIQSQQQQAQQAQQLAWQQQQQAIAQAQRTAAQQAGIEGNTAAREQLQGENQQQQSTDAQKTSLQTAAANASAIGAAGGQFDPAAQKAAALANLGLAAGGLPFSPANAAGSGAPASNPAATTAAAQQGARSAFQMPSMNGITFGGK